MGVLTDLVRREGLSSLWRGTTPSVLRAAILTSAQVVTYDEAKGLLIARAGLAKEDLATHVAASLLSGLVGTTACNPVDVIKTHMFVRGKEAGGVGGRPPGLLRCAAELLAAEGPGVFMKGWLANYARLGPHTTLIFVVGEFARSLVGPRRCN